MIWELSKYVLPLVFLVFHLRDLLRNCKNFQNSGWYQVSRKEVIQRGGKGLFRFHSSLAEALQSNFPEYNWDPSKFRASPTRTISSFFDANKQHLLLATLNDKFNIKEVRYPC